MSKFWIACISKNHIEYGKLQGFIQVCHGKFQPLKRMKKDDMILVYSSKKDMLDTVKYQKFTALGRISDDEIYQIQMSDDFFPFRRKVEYLNTQDLDILKIINVLDFIQDKQKWGFPFRYGLFEISEKDFSYIASKMIKA